MILNKMPDDFKAFIYCLQIIDSKTKNHQFIQICQDLTNWNQFIKVVRWHKVTPLVYNVLNEQYREHIPSIVLSTLKLHCDKNTSRVMKLTAELIRIGTFFQKEGIPFISFKGPLLTKRIYGDLTLREPRDLDLLIPENQLVITHQLLLQQGYRLYLPKEFPRSLPLYTRYQKDFSYIHPTKRIILELHWRLFNNQHEFIFPTKTLFNIAETEVSSSVSFSRMPTEIELLYLLHHGSTHSWIRLCWLYDIKQYLSHLVSPNWLNLLDMAKKIKTERSFFEGLILANQLLNVPLDPLIDKEIQQNKTAKSLAKTSYFVMTQSKLPTQFMRLKMLKSRFRLKEYSLSFHKEFLVRLMLRFLRVIQG